MVEVVGARGGSAREESHGQAAKTAGRAASRQTDVQTDSRRTILHFISTISPACGCSDGVLASDASNQSQHPANRGK